MGNPEMNGQSAPEEAPGRQAVRQASGFAVRVVWVDMSHACAGQLKDVSESGARVQVDAGDKARGDIYLLAHLGSEAEPRRIGGTVRWQVGDTIGVRFTPPLTPDLVAALAGA